MIHYYTGYCTSDFPHPGEVRERLGADALVVAKELGTGFYYILGESEWFYVGAPDNTSWTWTAVQKQRLVDLLRGHSLDTEEDVEYVSEMLLRNGVTL